MENKKKISLGIIFVMLCIMSIYVFQNHTGGRVINEPNDIDNLVNNQNNYTDNYTEESVSYAKIVEIENIEGLELNSHPSFSIGQKFFYKTSSIPVEEGYYFEEQTFTINGKERIDGSEYYVIIRNLTGYVSADPSDTVLTERFESMINTWYCDSENGRCVGKNVNPEKYSDENMFVTDSSLFAYWMLGLKDNAKWSMYLNATEKIDDGTYLKVNKKYEFEVIEKERVDEALCFKVKMTYIDTDTKEIRYVRNYWIDVKRRILIKKEEFESGIRIYEQNLIKEA